jgi:protoporphyrin/coproporphyrin ferrochelatase
MAKRGVLLVNLGTPSDSSPKAVRRFLKPFLNDPRVIDLPALLRFLLVYLCILPFRTKRTAHAYQKIWTNLGSPLMVYSQQLKEKLSIELGSDYCVALAMRYGNPSIQEALMELKHCNELTILPLFPQYSSAASGSTIENTLNILSHSWNFPNIRIISEFHSDPGYIAAYSELIKTHLADQKIDLLLFSYHGLPLRHIKKSHCRVACSNNQPCPAIDDRNIHCYRAQCYATSDLLAQTLMLPTDKYQVCFQSRLGSTPWIKPYTDLVLPELIQRGIKNIAIVCPSFVVDCLETLEEVNIRLREQWHLLGGAEFTFIPCLNAHPTWVKAIAKKVSGADSTKISI